MDPADVITRHAPLQENLLLILHDLQDASGRNVARQLEEMLGVRMGETALDRRTLARILERYRRG